MEKTKISLDGVEVIKYGNPILSNGKGPNDIRVLNIVECPHKDVNGSWVRLLDYEKLNMRLTEAKDMLDSLEYVINNVHGIDPASCQFCYGDEDEGHATNCRLENFLKDTKFICKHDYPEKGRYIRKVYTINQDKEKTDERFQTLCQLCGKYYDVSQDDFVAFLKER